jgi:hypothetical protein
LSSSYRAFEASWFIESVARKTQSNQGTNEVNALNAVGFEHLADFQKENMIINREKFRKERGYYDEILKISSFTPSIYNDLYAIVMLL